MSLVLCELADASPFGVPSLSPFCLKTHAALRLAGLPYTRRHGSRPGVFRPHNPTGQVPVLLHGDLPVADSTAILRQVLTLAPGALSATPEGWVLEEFADTSLNGFLVAARWADEANWPAVRDAYFGGAPTPIRWALGAWLRRGVLRSLVARDVWRAGPDACWARFGQLLDALEARAPAGGFWEGADPSVADVALYGQLRSFGTTLTPRQAGWVAARPRVSAWLGRMDERVLDQPLSSSR